MDSAQVVHFQLTLKDLPYGSSGWTGVAFGSTMRSGLDVIVVRLINSRVSVNDESVFGIRSPWPDQRQNVKTEMSSINNGVLQARFSRPLATNDVYGDRALNGCQPWQFPVTLSRLAPDGSLHMHQLTPRSRIVCIDQCRL
ncbi:unnamed protein product [Anisakis simplex]|uniref:DOMON domain-containing protein n=1 Tax=Anisakis simplex TaxID=6269 RepID=A0A3P6QMN9_ANISI|nr:unnamed protein product [Anisakis simplex]